MQLRLPIIAQRVLGVVLVLLVVVPVYRQLLGLETGLAGQATVAMSDLNTDVLWSGSLLALIPAILLAGVLRADRLEAWLNRFSTSLLAPRTGSYAIGLAVFTGLATLGFSIIILGGKPNLIDAMSQLLHARYMAEGKLGGPILTNGAFWHIQNTIVTPNGWVSQYPPGHILLLALGFRIGAVWVIGPLLAAVTVFFTVLVAERLLPEHRAVARLGAAFAAISPFLIGLAGAYMNHVTAAAFGTIAIYCALRARDGRMQWAIPTGAALAWTFGTRPLAGVVFGVVVLFGIWLGGHERGVYRGRRWLARSSVAGLGALPFIIALGVYNAHFFGSPFSFGYDVALGPSGGLGFQRDPWGNWYGPREALAYTSADLVALSLNLLETPVPVVVLVGIYLLCARQLSAGERIIVVWALLPVIANILYWHHGLFMGPRMLNEATPAWALLTAVAGVRVVQRIPRDWVVLRSRYSIRVAVTAFLLVGGGFGFIALAPVRMLGYGEDWQVSAWSTPPMVSEPAIIFIHGGWTSRVGMRLAAAGMRLDSLETALRQNPTCNVHTFALAREGKIDTELPLALDFNPRSLGFPLEVEISPGNKIRVNAEDRLSAECLREVQADRNGVLDISPLIWQGDLPGLPGKGALFVRDMGPEMNAELIRQLPDRTPMVLYTPSPDDSPILVPYDEGMAAIWTRTTDE